MGTAGAKAFGDMLLGNKTIQTLDVSDNSFGKPVVGDEVKIKSSGEMKTVTGTYKDEVIFEGSKNHPQACVQGYINPSEYEKSQVKLLGIHEATFQSIMACDVDIQKELFSNVVLTGGSSRFPGLCQRMRSELSKMVSGSVHVDVVCESRERPFSAWIGGSILSSLSTFKTMQMSRGDYEDGGSAAIHRWCF